ncbi:hypothetical protein FA15DRAFT_668062 [Coprinopsis marcescibilis]|uniref:ER-bound oxygenase mpaB/mpaB'/Rubber oxygenase catalytic domain-containing protein n=1 Tax=Coprinopsis marcescibilis TaxID=230819 RepID=A0A5C3L012_COPMA|nr:hypothetical protein FA15DRAFT_668062 [Coprinopsis marcescibilis]
MAFNQPLTGLRTVFSSAVTTLFGLQPKVVIPSLLVGYLTLVQLLRWRNYNLIHRKYQKKWENGELTPQEAQTIMQITVTYEMPLLMRLGLSLALFKTYAIPSISKLLLATKELGSGEKVAKRFADTEIILSTIANCPLSGFKDISLKKDDNTPAQDSRHSIALARMNYLHSRHKISNDDYLYTLSLFIIEPNVWADRYGWRRLSLIERDAPFIFWSEVGKRMGIKDIPGTFEELVSWSKGYEEQYMVPVESNHLVANLTTAELIAAVPQAFGLRKFVERLTICVLEDRVRIAMMQPEQPSYCIAFINALMGFSGFVQRWMLLPRRHPVLAIQTKLPSSSSERSRPNRFRSKPWYKPERSGLGYLLDQLTVKLGIYAALPSHDFRSAGYRLEEVGPLHLEKSGHDETFRDAERIQGCPISELFRP